MNDLIETNATPVTTLAQSSSHVEHTVYAGVQTARVFSNAARELTALTAGCGVFDEGWRKAIRVTGPDRGRWLNGMVTNTVKDLEPDHWNYTFLLNAQGRIQGDGELYAFPDELWLVTDYSQAERVRAHLDRFIIMDEVELVPDEDHTALGVAGPDALPLLRAAGLLSAELKEHMLHSAGDLLIVREGMHRFTLWASGSGAAPGSGVYELWERLQQAGATPCGSEAVESLRVLEGRPRYGVDMHDRSLAQETGQAQALNFNKGCYLGQEIVERIRSRATVHRGIRCFSLQGSMPEAGTPLFTDADRKSPVGELTSITSCALPELSGIYALGTVRAEAAAAPLHYDGGIAHTQQRAPLHTS